MSNRLLLSLAAVSIVLAIAGATLLQAEEPSPSPSVQAPQRPTPRTIVASPSTQTPPKAPEQPFQATPREVFDDEAADQARQVLIADRIDALDLNIEEARANGDHAYADALERRIEALEDRAEEGSEVP